VLLRFRFEYLPGTQLIDEIAKVEQDEEGLETTRNLGWSMARLLKKLNG